MAPSPPEKSAASTRRTFTRHVILIALISVAALLYLSSGSWNFFGILQSNKVDFDGGPIPPDQNSTACPQVPSIHPREHETLDLKLDSLYSRGEFQLHAYAALGGAIQIPTESYDDLEPVGKDERWDIFAKLHQYMEITFPLVYTSLDVTRVNTYGLVFHWKGSDTSLKPLLLAAHQDVVPVDPATFDQWDHPPYSGHYDGTWIWGRGSVDDKADLISQLIAVDSLLKNGFKPKRTIVLAFGIDEEASGTQGAGHLAQYLEKTYGANSFGLLVDEGDGYAERLGGGVIFASPGISEKGYLDVRIEVALPGGHSSVPPPHTSIGILALLIVAIEKNPHPTAFPRSGTSFADAQCSATYGPEYPSTLRRIARLALTDDKALEAFKSGLLASQPIYSAVFRTTQAADIVRGGVKVNALPEGAEVIINHRIAEHSSVADLQTHITDLLKPIAAKHNLSVKAFGRLIHNGQAGEVIISDAYASALEPSPITPIRGNGAYELLSGTIKATLQSSARYNGTGVVVSPSLGLGNTDTRFYWNLTENIFRYSHRGDIDDIYNGLHTVNEAVRAVSILEEIRFFTKLILNSDESSLF